jgi:hypothetical protein
LRPRYDTEYLLGTAFVDPETKQAIMKACDFSKPTTPACDALVAVMHNQIGHIDLYVSRCGGNIAVSLIAFLGA